MRMRTPMSGPRLLFPRTPCSSRFKGLVSGLRGLKAEFAWGYGGSGPAQLAVAMLMDRGVPFKGRRVLLPILHVRLHQPAA